MTRPGGSSHVLRDILPELPESHSRRGFHLPVCLRHFAFFGIAGPYFYSLWAAAIRQVMALLGGGDECYMELP